MKKTTLVIVMLVSPSAVSANCTFIDRGDSMEAVCIGDPPTASAQVQRENEIDLAEKVEQYKNGQSRQFYEQCKSFWPEVKTADDYKRMTFGDILTDKLARKSALARLEAMGCIPRGSSLERVQASQFISCSTYGGTTTCSDGSSFTAVGNTIMGSNGLNCSIVGSTMNCYKPK